MYGNCRMGRLRIKTHSKPFFTQKRPRKRGAFYFLVTRLFALTVAFVIVGLVNAFEDNFAVFGFIGQIRL